MTKQWLTIRPKVLPISFHLDRRVPLILLVLTIVTLVAMVFSVGYGEYPISSIDVVKTLLGLPPLLSIPYAYHELLLLL